MTETKPTSLGEALPRETKRCRDLLVDYRMLGPTGTFGAKLIEAALEEADRAMIEADLPAMIEAHETLKALK